MSARDRILDRLRKNAPNPAQLQAPILPETPSGANSAALIAQLTMCLEAAHAEVRRVARGGLAEALSGFCRDRSLKTLMLPSGGLPFEFAEAPPGLAVERFDRPFEELKSRLFLDVEAGLTVADCAIADTGTLVMASSPQQPRTLSLVPPIHLCLIDERRIHPSLAYAMQAEGWSPTLPTNLIFVSGPSKTADIQQTLAYGAHGPKELIVFLFDGSAA
jgi:L-lactate dehydrogenase complex protein LldG